MTEAPKTLPRLALPLVVSFTLRFFFQTIDLIYARWLDDPDAAIAAIGFWSPFQAIFIALWVGLSAGFTSSLANAFGSRDESRIRDLKSSLLRILVVVVPTLTLGSVGLWVAIPHFGLEPDLTEAFRIYGTTLCAGLPVASFWSVYPDSVIKAHHQMRLTMIAGLVATAVNVILNTWFVFGLGLGLFGIALATVLSRISSLVYAALQAGRLERQRRGTDEWSMSPTKSWPRATRTILAMSLPASVMFILGALESGVINGVLTRLPNSTEAIASFAVYERMLMLASMPAIGAAVAVLPYVARNLAEGRAAEVASNLRRTLVYAAIGALVFSVPAGLIFPAELAGFLFGDEVTDEAIGLLRLLPVAVLAVLPFVILRPVFEGALRPRLGVMVSVLRFAAFSIPLLLLGRYLAPQLGYHPLHGLVAGTISATLLASATTIVLCLRLEARRAANATSA